jgi:hypothetical protein
MVQVISSSAVQSLMNPEKPFVVPGHIPVSIPWSRAEWSTMTVKELQQDPKFSQLMNAWDQHLNTPTKKDLYYKILYVSLSVRADTAAELVSRPDFATLATPKPNERVNKEKLSTMLDTAADLVNAGPQFFPGPVETFEFLTVTLDYAMTLCEHYPHLKGQKVSEGIERVLAFSLPCLFAAVSQSLDVVRGN